MRKEINVNQKDELGGKIRRNFFLNGNHFTLFILKINKEVK